MAAGARGRSRPPPGSRDRSDRRAGRAGGQSGDLDDADRFRDGADPVKIGLVASLNRPGGNITGVVFTLVDLAAKLLGLLHELVPNASIIAVLHDPNATEAEAETRDLEEAGAPSGDKS